MMKTILDMLIDNINELNAYYDMKIKGRKWEEIQEEWEHYSEQYKELFGTRPVPAEFRK